MLLFLISLWMVFRCGNPCLCRDPHAEWWPMASAGDARPLASVGCLHGRDHLFQYHHGVCRSCCEEGSGNSPEVMDPANSCLGRGISRVAGHRLVEDGLGAAGTFQNICTHGPSMS